MGALDGLKILDFTGLYPGPLATMLLADLGAEVTRVDAPGRPDLLRFLPPHGPDGEGAMYRTVGRNKRSIVLDLKRPEAAGVIGRLVETHDIVVEQFRPGVMDRLGVGYAQLKARQPGLIFCSISAFGQTGPLAQRPGHDINFVALAGLSHHLGRASGGPVPLGTLVGDVGGGTWGAVTGILTAVIHRMKTGEGQRVDISMTDGALLMNAMAATEALAAGTDTAPEGHWLNGGTAYDYYRTADGRWLAVGSLEAKFYGALIQALGLPELEGQWLAQGEDAKAQKQAISAAISSHNLDHWRAVFADVPCCVEAVLTPTEAVDSELFGAREMVVAVPSSADDEGADSLRQVGNPIKLSACPPRYDHAGPLPGADTEMVLSAAGFGDSEIAALIADEVVVTAR
ncbi:MAG: CoA transferase [Myxococcales bacterium]|nr:CoA transferase [Myxococcales bacterium]